MTHPSFSPQPRSTQPSPLLRSRTVHRFHHPTSFQPQQAQQGMGSISTTSPRSEAFFSPFSNFYTPSSPTSSSQAVHHPATAVSSAAPSSRSGGGGLKQLMTGKARRQLFLPPSSPTTERAFSAPTSPVAVSSGRKGGRVDAVGNDTEVHHPHHQLPPSQLQQELHHPPSVLPPSGHPVVHYPFQHHHHPEYQQQEQEQERNDHDVHHDHDHAMIPNIFSRSSRRKDPPVVMGHSVRARDLVKIGELGKGASGGVVLALYKPTLTCVALKRVNVFQRSQRRQMVAELQAFSSVQSPNIVQFYGAYFSRGKGNIAMMLELMNCGSLEYQIQRLGPLPEVLIRHLALQLVEALHTLREACQLHRDIKPANILLNTAGECKLSDFGLSKQLDRRVAASCQAFVGTMAYLSPERLEHSSFSYPADVWSFGLTLVYTALGYLPLPVRNYWALRDMVNSDPPHIPPDVEGFSLEFRHFVSRCTAVKPEDRATIQELRNHPWLTGGKLSEFQRRMQLSLEEEYKTTGKQEMKKKKKKVEKKKKKMEQKETEKEKKKKEATEKMDDDATERFVETEKSTFITEEEEEEEGSEDDADNDPAEDFYTRPPGLPPDRRFEMEQDFLLHGKLPFRRAQCTVFTEHVHEKVIDAVLEYHFTWRGHVFRNTPADRDFFIKIAEILDLDPKKLLELALRKTGNIGDDGGEARQPMVMMEEETELRMKEGVIPPTPNTADDSILPDDDDDDQSFASPSLEQEKKKEEERDPRMTEVDDDDVDDDVDDDHDDDDPEQNYGKNFISSPLLFPGLRGNPDDLEGLDESHEDEETEGSEATMH